MLSVDVLHRHPQNPRKGIGNVEELADSIKKNGVMQNLSCVNHNHILDRGESDKDKSMDRAWPMDEPDHRRSGDQNRAVENANKDK
ncbi:hypothetical protein BXO88_02765 [Oribacterium sp. C9]|nr:hypothetical protein BXO88_02765 [Oribacterium sp. C9]